MTGWNHYQQPISRGHARQTAQENLVALFDRCAQPNWDGHNAAAVSQQVYCLAYRLLEALPPDLPLPEFGAEPDGQLTFEWHRAARRTLSVSISPDGDLHFAALLGASRNYGTEAFWGDLPQPILELIGRVFMG